MCLVGSEENVKITLFRLVLILNAGIPLAFLEVVSFVLLSTTISCSSPASYVSCGLFSYFFLSFGLCCILFFSMSVFTPFNSLWTSTILPITYYNESIFFVTVSPVLYLHISIWLQDKFFLRLIKNWDHTIFPPKPVSLSLVLHIFMLWCLFFKGTPWDNL